MNWVQDEEWLRRPTNRQFNWIERSPVKGETMGSNPILYIVSRRRVGKRILKNSNLAINVL